MSKVRVLIVEDEPLIARDIKKHLAHIEYEAVGIAYNSDKAIDMLFHRQPEIVILDINIKGSMDGIDIAHIINEKYKIPFIYLTSYADSGTIERAKPTFPAGYILKPFDEKDLLTTIEMAIYKHKNNRTGVMPTLAEINKKYDGQFSEREYEILHSIVNGLTNAQMAANYYVSENTIKSHIKRIYVKLRTHNRAETTKLILSI